MLPGNSINLIYIDGTDAASEGTFKSTKVGGATLSYTNWAGNEPNNWDGVEHCVNMYAEDNGLWNDLKCDLLLPAVCEIEKGAYICMHDIVFAVQIWSLELLVCIHDYLSTKPNKNKGLILDRGMRSCADEVCACLCAFNE